MTPKSPWGRVIAVAGGVILLAGFAVPAVGAWTTIIVSAWLIGVMGAFPGLAILLLLGVAQKLLVRWTGLGVPAGEYAAWIVPGVLITIAPYLLHRLAGRRVFGAVGTLVLPVAALGFGQIARAALPAAMGGYYAIAVTPPGRIFLVYWVAAVLNWLWDYDFRPGRAGWPMVRIRQDQPWSRKEEVVALLRSPRSGEPLRLEGVGGREVLASASGERFEICGGIPNFLSADDLTGDNLKYNVLYERIGGVYDSIQKIGLAAMNVNRDYLIISGLRLLEIKPGDRVLETSVGTGLMLRFLPRGVKIFGLDMSATMLDACRATVARWGLDAQLFRGNAERLPFADETFDVVYHVGGINFFTDRVRAIREMIRVARPGTRILISDETEQHVKEAYEPVPLSGALYKDRSGAVAAPIDLVPAEMEEISLETIFDGRGYVLTFRKPGR